MVVQTEQKMIEFQKNSPVLIVPGALAMLWLVFLLLWLFQPAVMDFSQRLPSEQDFIVVEQQVSAGPQFGTLETFDVVAADLPGYWPGFRGANLDAICDQETPLADTWPENGPAKLWTLELGEGFAGAAVMDGKVYIIDYDQEKKADAIRCMSLENAQDIWRYSYPIVVKRNHGMSRTVPAVTEKYVVTIGPLGHVTCLDSQTGDMLWYIDLVADYGTTIPQWYAGQCPLLQDDKLIVAPAGPEVLMMAVDCATGDIIWKCPNPNNWKMTHGSITPAYLSDTKMYVYCASDGVVGVSAEDGSLLWEYWDWKIPMANVASPIVIGDGRIFLSGGYHAGSMILQLVRQGQQIIAEPVFWPQFSIDAKYQQDLNAGVISDELWEELRKNDVILSKEGVTVTADAESSLWQITDGIKQYTITATEQGLVFATTRLKEEVFGSEQHTPILYEGHIYGMRPDRQFVCIDLQGNPLWESPRTARFGTSGLGPYSIADGKIYILDDEGTLTIAKAQPTEYVQLAQAKIFNAREAWAPMAFAEGRLIIRDMTQMICLDIAR